MAVPNTLIPESTLKRSRDSSESPKLASKKPRSSNPMSLESHVHEVSNGVDLSPKNASQSKHSMSIKDDSPPALSESTQRIMAFFAQDIPISKEYHERMHHFEVTTTSEELRLYYTETGQDIPKYLDRSFDGPKDSKSLEYGTKKALEEIHEWEQSGLANSMNDDELSSDSEE